MNKFSNRIAIGLTAIFVVMTIAACGKSDPESDFKVEPLTGGKSVQITGYLGNKFEVSIPQKIQKLPVTHIGDRAFEEKNIIAVNIPKNVTVIGEYAFRSNKLTKITIHNGVTSIGNNAFANNQLTSVTIPHSVTHLSGFNGNQLASIAIPDSVTSIGDEAFAANQLSGVTIPGSVTSIGKNAFADNQLSSIIIPNSVIHLGGFSGNQLTDIVIPDSVTSIGDEAFSKNQLTSVTIPDSVTSLSGFNDNQLTDIIIPDSVTSIGSKAFSGNQLTGITIPSSVTSIGDGAFTGNRLTSIVIGANVQINTDTSTPANSSFGNNGFERAYSNNRRAAWTYTRTNTNSTTWIRQPKSLRITGTGSRFSNFVQFNLFRTLNSYDYSIGSTPTSTATIKDGIFTTTIYNNPNPSSPSGNWTGWMGAGDFYVNIIFEASSGGWESYNSKSRISFENIVTEIPFTEFNFVSPPIGQ